MKEEDTRVSEHLLDARRCDEQRWVSFAHQEAVLLRVAIDEQRLEARHRRITRVGATTKRLVHLRIGHLNLLQS